MTKIARLHSLPDAILEDEKLREIARRALAPPDFPFDGLHIEAALLLNQLAGRDIASAACSEAADSPKRRAYPRHHQIKPERRLI